jgi:Flp pilus assembly protein TadB
MSFGLNLNSLAFARRLRNEGAATGTVTLSAGFAVGDMGYRALGGAVIFLVTGLVFAQLALLGGALILAISGFMYVRRSRRQRMRL